MNIEEEQISWPFRILDPNTGEVLFRDALTFNSVTEFRNTSQAEREVMQQKRYEDRLAAIQYAQDHPEESAAPQEA